MTTAVDPTGTSYLVVIVGGDEETHVARRWVAAAERIAPTTLLVLDSLTIAEDRSALAEALGALRVGSRVMVAGGRYDVLQALAQARQHGALTAEIAGQITHTRDLPLYCAHCRDTFQVAAEPGGEVTCPGCCRRLEVHEHLASALGSFLASDAMARELVP